jgi:two-component system, LytTR family, sensor kinase
MLLKINRKVAIGTIHTMVWMIIVSIPHYFWKSPSERTLLGKDIGLWVIIIAFFYINYNLLIPRLLAKKRFLQYAAIILVMLSASYYSSILISSRAEIRREVANFKHQPPPEEIDRMIEGMQKGRATFSMMFCFLFLALSTSIRVTEQWYTNEKERKEMENQKLTAELSFLKSQINPHFFSNTLNSIYSLAIRKSEKTPEAIIKLSLLMRYIIYETDKPYVPLQKELEYINNYVELQRLRIKENVTILYTIAGESKDRFIEPMLLLPFIENAFKHGIDYSKPCEITIEVNITDESIRLVIENPLVSKQLSIPDEASGIGLVNSRKRLQLLYEGKHELNISEKGEKFRVDLILNIRENELHNSG